MANSHEVLYYRFLLAETLGIDDKTLDTCGFKVTRPQYGNPIITVTVGMGTDRVEETQYDGDKAKRIMSLVEDVHIATAALKTEKENEEEQALEESLWKS